MTLAFSWSDLVSLTLSVFLLAVGLSLAYAFVRLGGTFGRVSALLKGTQDEVLPVINKVGGTVDHVNGQLAKVDVMTDSAVDAVGSADTAVRAVTFAITRPVQKLSGFAAGMSHGFAELRVRKDFGGAVAAGKAAAARREAELEEELRSPDGSRG
jgi:hypothetical protein